MSFYCQRHDDGEAGQRPWGVMPPFKSSIGMGHASKDNQVRRHHNSLARVGDDNHQQSLSHVIPQGQQLYRVIIASG